MLTACQTRGYGKQTHLLLGELFEAVDPAVSDAVAELLFLSVQDVLRKERVLGRVERLPDDELLDRLALELLRHFVLEEG